MSKNTTLTAPKHDPQAAMAAAMNLAAMNPQQLAAAGRSLVAAEARHDRMSGICGILAGLVMLEGKRRFEHGGFQEWLKEHFSKVIHGSLLEFKKSYDYRTCAFRMRVAEGFLGKARRTAGLQPEQLLLEEFAQHLAAEQAGPMDEQNPVVAAVSEYVDGRSFRQLRDELPMLPRGGPRERSGPEPELTPEEEEALFLKASRQDFAAFTQSLDGMVVKATWQARSIADAELEAAADVAKQFAEQVDAWLKLPQKRRTPRALRDAVMATENAESAEQANL